MLGSVILSHSANASSDTALFSCGDADCDTGMVFAAIHLPRMRSASARAVIDLTAFEPQPDGFSLRDSSAGKSGIESLFAKRPAVLAR